MSRASEVTVARSRAQACAAFGDGVTVVAGGTIVVPMVALGRQRPDGVLLLNAPDLAGVRERTTDWFIGAATTLDQLGGLPEPIPSTAAGIADPEVRAQATLGGNLCAPAQAEAPVGDLQGALLVLDARVECYDGGRERELPVREFLASSSPRRGLVLGVVVPKSRRRAGWASLRRSHTHSYTALAVQVSAEVTGVLREVRVAATGLSGGGVRLPRLESELEGLSVTDAVASAIEASRDLEVVPIEDALLSRAYRRRVFPVLLGRAVRRLLGQEV